MEFKKANHFWSLVLLLCLSRGTSATRFVRLLNDGNTTNELNLGSGVSFPEDLVCHGQLMCYVCENCAQVTAETAQFQCNEDFFNTEEQTDVPVHTTTGLTEDNDTTEADVTTLTPSTTIHTEETTSTTTTTTTTTESKTPESTTSVSSENTTETSTETTAENTTALIPETTQAITTTSTTTTTTTTTTESQSPTTSTASSTAGPTPINLDTVKPLDDVDTLNNQSIAQQQPVNKDEVEVVATDIEEGTTKAYKPSAEFRVRQLRSINDVTFHCFKVHAIVNDSMVVNRGCSRLQTNESVCSQWEKLHPNDKMNNCYHCSRSKCNGSSAVNVSITVLFVAVVAVFLHRK